MRLFHQKSLLHIFEIVFWFSCSLFYYIYLLNSFHAGCGLFYTVIVMSEYAFIIYFNAYYLLPRFYNKKYILFYLLLVILIIAGFSFIRHYSSFCLHDYFLNKKIPLHAISIGYYSLMNLICFFVSFLFRSALDYLSLHEQQENLKSKHLQAELNLLKAQVQPHFLFNALHNMYATAYVESPATAQQIEKLSGIMRYFVDEAQKEKVSLQTELNFISNYIELERIRMRYPISIIKKFPENITDIHIPPMLLVPLIENVFKHGIDKRSKDNFLNMDLSIKGNRFFFTVLNKLYSDTINFQYAGVGLKNLKSRLEILFKSDYSLSTKHVNGIFETHINFPLI